MAYLGTMSNTTYTLGNRRVFFGPWLDFLFMGGGSLIALPLLAALIPDTALPQVGSAVLVLAVIINHPHFAHSYQIFYANYRPIMQAPRIDAKFRLLYLWSGVGVPALLFGYFALTLFLGEPAMLRYAVNAMMFFVGWHYVKQG